MNWYKATLDRVWPCGNYKCLHYWVQALDMEKARRHVQQRHPTWRLMFITTSAAPHVLGPPQETRP